MAKAKKREENEAIAQEENVPSPVRIKAQRNDLSPPANQTIEFKSWFTNLLDNDRRVKQHHYEQLRLFMKGLGLGESEPTSKYESGLRAYFGN